MHKVLAHDVAIILSIIALVSEHNKVDIFLLIVELLNYLGLSRVPKLSRILKPFHIPLNQHFSHIAWWLYLVLKIHPPYFRVLLDHMIIRRGPTTISLDEHNGNNRTYKYHNAILEYRSVAQWPQVLSIMCQDLTCTHWSGAQMWLIYHCIW